MGNQLAPKEIFMPCGYVIPPAASAREKAQGEFLLPVLCGKVLSKRLAY
jgi:hypothetical protein